MGDLRPKNGHFGPKNGRFLGKNQTNLWEAISRATERLERPELDQLRGFRGVESESGLRFLPRSLLREVQEAPPGGLGFPGSACGCLFLGGLPPGPRDFLGSKRRHTDPRAKDMH